MSKDTRLGIDPLNWMAPGTPPAQHVCVAKVCTPPAAAPPRTGGRGLFQPADTPHKENPMSKDKFKIKQTLDTAQVAAHLEDLADSIKAGIVRVDDGNDNMVLHVGEAMHFEMKVSRKKDKAKCSIELEWTDDGSRLDSFTISDK